MYTLYYAPFNSFAFLYLFIFCFMCQPASVIIGWSHHINCLQWTRIAYILCSNMKIILFSYSPVQIYLRLLHNVTSSIISYVFVRFDSSRSYYSSWNSPIGIQLHLYDVFGQNHPFYLIHFRFLSYLLNFTFNNTPSTLFKNKIYVNYPAKHIKSSKSKI